jgi:hypothetical protein
MAVALVLPPAPAGWETLQPAGASLWVVEPAEGPDSSLAARVCAAINERGPEPPLAVIAGGSGALLLPAVARAQRSTHRLVIDYLLIEPELPSVTDSWPDAPVTVVSSDQWVTTQAQLRGWDLLDADRLSEWSPRWLSR